MSNVEHIAILGMTGTGKTYFIRDIIKKAKMNSTKIIILDIEEDYGNLGAIVLKNYKNISKYKNKQVIRLLTEDYNEDQMQSHVYDYVFKNVRNALIVIDEVHNQGGEQSKLDANLKRLITRGRKRGLKLIVASQRPALVDKTILSNCGTLVLKKVGWSTDWNLYNSINKEACELLKSSKNKYSYVILRQGIIWDYNL
ncbi:MAG TPA: DUF87 domain-containing protein [Candidatus Nanopusillus sp.]|nr:DUF87 domain-containing protein [Candidatus Nanopusillus sp.]